MLELISAVSSLPVTVNPNTYHPVVVAHTCGSVYVCQLYMQHLMVRWDGGHRGKTDMIPLIWWEISVG